MTACTTSNVGNVAARKGTDSAICIGLEQPVDSFVAAMLRNKENTPDEVIIEGTRVVKGYDAACN